MPGAINLPVLDNEERARVGTIYVQQSPFLARKLGAALVFRNAADHIEKHLSHHEGRLEAVGLLLAWGAAVGVFRMDASTNWLAG